MTKVTLECDAKGWTWRVFDGERLVVEHMMKMAPSGAKGVTKGGISDKLDALGHDDDAVTELADAIQAGDAYEICQALGVLTDDA
jgi:hypothetical protein